LRYYWDHESIIGELDGEPISGIIEEEVVGETNRKREYSFRVTEG